jgi:hypothetical protein
LNIRAGTEAGPVRRIMRIWISFVLCVFLATGQVPRDPRDTSPAVGTGVIRGRVLAADTGAPIPYAQVALYMDGPEFRARAVTSDRAGRYEFVALPAGTYHLNAMPPPHVGRFARDYAGGPKTPEPIHLGDGGVVEKADISFAPGAVISGRVVDEAGEPLADIEVQPLLLSSSGNPRLTPLSRQTDDTGGFRLFGLPPGEYILRAQTQGTVASGRVVDEGQAPGFVPTYFPAGLSTAEASRVRVRPGQELQGIEIRLVRTRTFRVSGIVLDSHGRPATGADGSLNQNTLHGGWGTGFRVDAQGRFVLNHVLPGEYRITMSPDRFNDDASGPREFADVPIEVTTADIEGLVVTTHSAAIIAGTIRFEDNPPAGEWQMHIMASTPDPRDASIGAAPTIVRKDGSFTLKDLYGPLLVRTLGLEDWWLKAVLLGNQDITDTPTEFQARDSGRLTVVMTQRASTVTGSVKDDKGQPTQADVLLFGAEPADWIPSSSRTHRYTSSKSGRFAIRGVRAGRYLIVALPAGSIDFDGIGGPDLIRPLAPLATAVYVGEDERRAIDLRVVSRQ